MRRCCHRWKQLTDVKIERLRRNCCCIIIIFPKPSAGGLFRGDDTIGDDLVAHNLVWSNRRGIILNNIMVSALTTYAQRSPKYYYRIELTGLNNFWTLRLQIQIPKTWYIIKPKVTILLRRVLASRYGRNLRTKFILLKNDNGRLQWNYNRSLSIIIWVRLWNANWVGTQPNNYIILSTRWTK